MNGHKTEDSTVIGDFCDGQKYLQVSTDHTALQIFLYFDDFEICNPLGSKSKKHKLG